MSVHAETGGREIAIARREAASALVQYNKMTQALAVCASVDEAAKIRDDCERMTAYARIRDDNDAAINFAELRQRAGFKVGEISRALPKAHKVGRGKDIQLPSDGKSKEDALAAAGLSTSTAQRLEELAGGATAQGQKAAATALEKYLAEQRKAGVPATDKGLRAAITSAVREVTGQEKPKRGTAAGPPSPLYLAWLDFVSAIKTIAEHNSASLADMAEQGRKGGALADTLREARAAGKRLPKWIAALEREENRGSHS